MNRICTGNFLAHWPEAMLVDCFVTSPDYNIGVAYPGKKSSKALKWEAYLEFTCAWALKASQMAASGCSLFLNFGYTPSEPMKPFEVVRAIESVPDGWKVQNVIHWVKSITVDEHWMGSTYRSYGHFKPINSKTLVNGLHEYVFHFRRACDTPVELDRLAVGVPYQDQSNVKRWKGTEGKNLRCRGNVWYIPYETIQSRKEDRGGHPAVFPVALAEQCMKLHGVGKIRLACDPFVGTGSSAVAAANLGVDFVGYEIRSEIAAYARKRLLEAGVKHG